MNTPIGRSPARSSSSPRNNNPLARAMADAEREKGGAVNQPNKSADSNSLLSEALSRTGGQLPQNLENGQDEKTQQEAMERQRQRDLLRKQLHDKVNPTKTEHLFDARRKKEKEEINSIRKELELLIKDVKGLSTEIEKAAKEDVVDAGYENAAYHKSFFAKLRSFIILMRQKIKSTRTWAKMHNSKKKKKKKGKRPGMESGSAGHEKTSMVHNMMHHEQSSTYSGN